MSNSVTSFTISDFGRTLTSNSDGTDHGWGVTNLSWVVRCRAEYVRAVSVIGSNQANDLARGRLIRDCSGAITRTLAKLRRNRWFPNLGTLAPALPWIHWLEQSCGEGSALPTRMDGA